MSKLRVDVIGIVGLPASYGGFETLVENLVINKSKNVKYKVYCSSKSYQVHQCFYKGASLEYLNVNPNGASSIFYDIFSLMKSIKSKPNVVLILGVSGCLFLPIFRTLSKSKIVINIDGLEWKRDKWGFFAKKFLKLSEYVAIKFSDSIITDNQAITEYVKQVYNIDSHTIAYGGDNALCVSDYKIRDEVDISSLTPYFLGLCRIEPENNVEMILKAFDGIDKKLVFIGNWNASLYGKSLKEKYGALKNIILKDPIYDIDTLYQYRKNCIAYIHGHSAGGTNPTLVEIMHFEKHVLAFDCVFNRFTTDNCCDYFINTEDIIKIVSKDPVYFKESIQAKKLKSIADKLYTWKYISELYENLYK
ncbi:DUF1972 domain-containing protein [Vibrio cholerae]|uniref:DUF1972 domain-containing protein n=1 Tax=Vibrio cholerae TaxID=666 RepID=UPI000F3C0B5A|nr:DUF1972 domain-containing protein [Vibrio cholerae]MCQ0983652.1 DUF1972 domain-containing protein [Vibrio cholerae]RNE65802.1 DUF1972 domain-containing protein [Vibrio cholerae]